MIATAALTWLTFVLNDHNESRLLSLKVRELGTVFTTVVPDVESPLASGSVVADLTHGAPSAFRQEIAGSVGAGRIFVSASLWQLTTRGARLIATVGKPSDLSPASHSTQVVLRSARRSRTVSAIGLQTSRQPRLGFEYNAARSSWLVVGEAPLPSHRLAPISPSSPFADINYALYLGRSMTHRSLLESSVTSLPLRGRTASDVVPFGSAVLTLVATPIGALGGSLLGNLPWIIATAGVLFTVLATVFAERLARRRAEAMQLATENRNLYAEQRNIAETLQRSLLPRELPSVTGVELAARYIPGTAGVEVGGDWYTAVQIDEDRFAFVVGDVSGRGVRAASVMASLRYTTRAYVSLGFEPERVLEMAARELRIAIEGHFATALVGLADNARRTLTLASAGHLCPLLIGKSGPAYVDVPIGVPLGLKPRPYRSTTIPIAPGTTLLAFTDGLVERRGEVIDEGMTRLRQCTANGTTETVDALLTRIVSELTDARADDDMALLGIRWLN